MISVTDAKKRITDAFEPNKAFEWKPMHEAYGHIVATDVIAPCEVPHFDNAAMDGYALAHNGMQSSYTVASQIKAGDVPVPTDSNTNAYRIFTGAMVPPQCNTVIAQELVQRNGNTLLFDPQALKIGANVRKQGSQCKKGDLVLQNGTFVHAGTIGLLSSMGIKEVCVFSAPKVAIVVTGNEVQEPGTVLKPGNVFNANGPMLQACLQNMHINVLATYRPADEANEVFEVLQQALKASDVVLITGGISVGDYDFVKPALERLGVTELFYKVQQKPGKPLYIGKLASKWIFALPGNPASVLTCFYQYAKPVLKALQGFPLITHATINVPLTNNYQKSAGLTHFLKAHTNGATVTITGGQDSFNLQPFSKANCWVEMDSTLTQLQAGDVVPVYVLDPTTLYL